MDPPETFTAFERRRWQQAAKEYARVFSPLTSQAIEPLLNATKVAAGTRVLEVACGSGDLAATALDRGAQVAAIDFSEEMVEIARNRHPELDVRSGEAESLQFADHTFEAVIMAFLLGHLADPDRALAEAHRVLAGGGRFATVWWSDVDRAEALGLLMKAVSEHGRTDVQLPAALPFDHFSDPAALGGALRSAGFAEVRVVEVRMTWRLRSGEALFEAYARGTARNAALLEAQTPEAFVEIRAAVVANARRFKTPAGDLEIPMPVWLGSGVREG